MIAPIGSGKRGETFNINADEVAAQVAMDLGATKLLYLTDVPGILHADELVSEATPAQIGELIEAGVVRGGMIPKVRCCIEALSDGDARAHIIDGRIRHAVLLEIFTDGGVGTLLSP